MKRPRERDTKLHNLLTDNRIATIEELKAALETTATMTVFRCLSRLGYLSSYSHRGRFYTLAEIADFDGRGLWSWRSARFSRFGNLQETAAVLVQRSEAGYTASELESVLQVEVKHALLRQVRRGRIGRTRLGGNFVYLSEEAGERRRQELMRQEGEDRRQVGATLESEFLPDELRVAIILFFSLLDEKQRRLYAGLEAAKLGHGGDRKMAELLDLAPQTVAKGRRELLTGSVRRGRVRKAGGGRKRIEKKRRR